MPLKNVHYQKVETEESDLEEDELPPSHVKLQGTNHVKGKSSGGGDVYLLKFSCFSGVRSFFALLWSVGDRWNHIDNLDEFFERVSFNTRLENGLCVCERGIV